MRARKGVLLGAAVVCAGCVRSMNGSDGREAKPSDTDRMFAALAPTKLTPNDASKKLDLAVSSHFEASATRRSYIMTDKPLYRPGEVIWLRADLRATGTLVASPLSATVQLVSPRGAVVAEKRVYAANGVAPCDFDLPAEIEGGEYTLTLLTDDGTHDTRKLVVSTYEPPRLKKNVELLRKAYGEGDKVSAAIEIARSTGEPFADKSVTGIVTVDDVEVQRIAIRTDKDGKALARFDLPAKIARGDGSLTLLADDGGVVESIQRRIPIVLKTLELALYPEGGDLVEGLPGRVYFAAKNGLGKPADVEGRVVDDQGKVVAQLKSLHDGMGRFELTPSPERTYKVEIEKPAGIASTFAVPAAKPHGCIVRSVDDARLRVVAVCDTSRTLLVEAVLREKNVATGSVEVAAGKPALLDLPIGETAQGAVRVTLFSDEAEPLAERLVYHGRGADLRVSISADKKSYSPRDRVKLRVRTTDAAGKPVAANVGLGVVDDTVLSFADDKSARILAHLFLEPELRVGGGARDTPPVEEPNYYFSDKPDAPAAMDALLATRGWRRFEWRAVLEPKPVASAMAVATATAAPPPAAAPALAAVPRKAMAAPRPVAAMPKPVKAPEPAKEQAPARNRVAAGAAGVGRLAAGPMPRRPIALDDAAWGDMPVPVLAPVRVFPVPEYTKGYDGPRTDFRETIYWNPAVQTDESGTAEVSFVASDAVTSFRATAEGFSATGLAGGGEAVIASRLPLALDARLPAEVTSGDEIRLPVTITNETDEALDANLATAFGSAFQPIAGAPADRLRLAAGEKRSLFFPLRVAATEGEGDVALSLATLGLKDQLAKKIRVVPLGFPFEVSRSGTLGAGAAARHEIDLAGALPGSVHASVTMYPSPVAGMTQGMEGMIREPGGCFEQTSSTNYPNVMILDYLGANDAAAPGLLQRTHGQIERGYKLLTGYETPQKGYEWFGRSPGHEALTAYGLMEFADMAKVYDVDRTMIERTASWLMSRRDRKGGFQRSTEALDSFGRAGEATTNAYIMWALAEAKRTNGLEKELAKVRKLGAETSDPYLLALAANTLLLAMPKSDEANVAVKRLAAMQEKDGSFPGAHETITKSGGESLVIETTSLAALALLKADDETPARAAVDYLNAHRGGFGSWGNTQATILSLKALSTYATHARKMQASGKATLVVNGRNVGTIAFEKGHRDALVWDDVAAALEPGKNTIELRLDSTASLPYSVAVSYRAARPASSPNAKVTVATSIDKGVVKMGEGVKIHAHVENKTQDGVPMTLARVGIPGGLAFQTWQLKELREKGVVDFYETKPREVVLYWRALPPAAKKDVDLELLAQVPGTYEGPPSSAYLYYTAEDKAWTAPVKVRVER